jgi:hypothetical protein
MTGGFHFNFYKKKLRISPEFFPSFNQNLEIIFLALTPEMFVV